MAVEHLARLPHRVLHLVRRSHVPGRDTFWVMVCIVHERVSCGLAAMNNPTDELVARMGRLVAFALYYVRNYGMSRLGLPDADDSEVRALHDLSKMWWLITLVLRNGLDTVVGQTGWSALRKLAARI